MLKISFMLTRFTEGRDINVPEILHSKRQNSSAIESASRWDTLTFPYLRNQGTLISTRLIPGLLGTPSLESPELRPGYPVSIHRTILRAMVSTRPVPEGITRTAHRSLLIQETYVRYTSALSLQTNLSQTRMLTIRR